MDRVLRDTKSEIRVTVTSNGLATDADSTPTVTITRDSTGAAVVTDAATTKPTETTGVYAYSLTPSQIPDVERLRAVWRATIGGQAGQEFRTEVDVVGGFLCTLDAIKAELPSSLPAPSNTELAEARRWAEDKIERGCGVSFRPRYASETRNGNDRTDIQLDHPRPLALIAATLDGTSVLADVKLEEPEGIAYLENKWTKGRRNVRLVYEHGYESPPEAITHAAIRLARYRLIDDPSNFDERATRIDTEDASYSLVTAGVRGALTPLPDVNQTIEDYREPRTPTLA